jgi:hypothetical protein
MRPFALFAACVVFLFQPIDSSAQEAEPESSSLTPVEVMRARAVTTKVTAVMPGGKKPVAVPLVETPLLRYADAGGITTDGTIWAFGEKGRPVALAGVFYLREEGKPDEWSCELLALHNSTVSATGGAGWKWTPGEAHLRFNPLGGRVSDDDKARLRQMKELARGFAVSDFFNGRPTQLRLMIQPLHRYADADGGLIDGAIFSFASGTNPEVLVLIEARKAVSGVVGWHFACARMAAAPCLVKRGEVEVWSCPPIDRWDANASYYSEFGPEVKVFGLTERQP